MCSYLVYQTLNILFSVVNMITYCICFRQFEDETLEKMTGCILMKKLIQNLLITNYICNMLPHNTIAKMAPFASPSTSPIFFNRM